MENFVVLYHIKAIQSPAEQPFGFQCYADDADHAEEQALNAYPDAEIVWVWQGEEGTGMQPAINDYYENIDAKPMTPEQQARAAHLVECLRSDLLFYLDNPNEFSSEYFKDMLIAADQALEIIKGKQ